MQNFIPEHKLDLEAVLNLQELPFEKVKPFVKELLDWCADANWPVAGPIFEYFEPYVADIQEELKEILLGDDETWKYWIICMLIDSGDETPVAEGLKDILTRIAYQPTLAEMEEEVDEVAQACLEQFDVETATAIQFDLNWKAETTEEQKHAFWELLDQLMQDQGLEKIVQKDLDKGKLRQKDGELGLRNLRLTFYKTMDSIAASLEHAPASFSTRYVE